MSRAGRKPLPRNVRILRGETRPSRNHPDEPQPEVKIPDPPDTLQGEEVDVFINYARLLAKMKVMTEADTMALEILARNTVVWREANAMVREMGLLIRSPNNFPVHNPYLSIANKAQAECLKILTEFGLTPSSRTRVRKE